MTDDPAETRRRYFEEIADRVRKYEDRSFEYEKQAIDFANNAFRVLTYLNGGALVAIPTAVALFQANIQQAKTSLVIAAVCFVSGLLSIVLSQGSAFFTMARRAEAQEEMQAEQTILTALAYYPTLYPNAAEAQQKAAAHRATVEIKYRRSNEWRLTGILLFWVSLATFTVGCYFGARAIIG